MTSATDRDIATQMNAQIDTAIAVIGMACRLPGAADPGQFWANLISGIDSVRAITSDELRTWGQDPAQLADPRYVALHGVVDGVGEFDADFFGYSVRDADMLNPQNQMFLECAWEAMEQAGYDSAAVPGPVGVFGGAGRNGYGAVVASRIDDLFPGVDEMAVHVANEPEHLCTRIAYQLGLTGPAVTVLTTCSSSLVAVHEAARALLAGDCDMALAGGVTVRAPLVGYQYREGGTMSPDGHCRTFSSDARGIVGGDAAGVVVLRRLRDAIEDGEHIRAVIRGSSVNNDGRDRAGYTAPSVRGQTDVIMAAHAAADVRPDTIGYVEAHGTGTPVGDPIEVAALNQAFRTGAARPGSTILGAVKTNIGHTDTASGVVGLIKTVLVLENQVIPGNLSFASPNPAIDFTAGPFTVATGNRDWPSGGLPRRAGVSSFGIGGTNAHVVLEEAPPVTEAASTWPAHLLPLAARTPAALDVMADRLAAHLAGHPEQQLADVAYTLQNGRRPFQYRRHVVATDHAAAVAALATHGTAPAAAAPSVVFVLPDDMPGAGHADAIHRAFPAFRAAAQECYDILPDSRPDQFVTQYALARLWQDWGIAPDAVVGRGTGELVARCLAGEVLLATALAVVTGTHIGPVESMAGSVPVLPAPQPGQLTLGIDLPADGDAATAFAAVLDTAGRLWSAGVPVVWSRLHRDTARRRVPLPTYPFERGHHIVYPRTAEPVAPSRPERPASDESVAGRLRMMFRQILGASDDVTDGDFFELGGDSLAAVELVALIEEAFAVAPPLDAVFDAPTVAGLAKVVEDMLGTSS